MNNLFKNIYLNNILILILLVILFLIIYYFNIKDYDKFNLQEDSKLNAQIYLQNSDNDIDFKLDKPDLAKTGPIKFVDAENTNILLGKYPEDWTEEELIQNKMTPTIIKIPRGNKGDDGKQGESSVLDIKETVSLEEINSDNLKINTNNLNLNAKKINFNNSLCFGDDNNYCIDADLINYMKDTNNLIAEKTQTTNLIKEKTSFLDKCKKDLTTLQDNIDKNYFSKHLDVPSLYISTKKCDEDKLKLVNLYQNITNADELKKSYEKLTLDNARLQGQLSLKDQNISEINEDLKICRDSKTSQNTDIVNIITDSAMARDTTYSLQQRLDKCHKEKCNLDMNNYMLKSEHDAIIFDNYISKNNVKNKYTSNTDIDITYKDDYGNYLTNDYVKNNYYNKEINDAQFEIKCQKKIEDATSDDIIRSSFYKNTTSIDQKLENLKTLYNNKFSENKSKLDECLIDKKNNYYQKNDIHQNYRTLSDIQNNYILKIDHDATLMNDYLSNDTINRDYIKNDEYFKDNYATKIQYNSLNDLLNKCNEEKRIKDTENEGLEKQIVDLSSELDNMDCTDCEEFTKGTKKLLEMCQKDKTACITRETTLKDDIKKLSDFIKKLYNNISTKESQISFIKSELDNKTNAHQSDVESLTTQIDDTSSELSERESSIDFYKSEVDELDKLRKDALIVINKLEKDIIKNKNDIELTQDELDSKLVLLQNASKQIQKCKTLELEARESTKQIAVLNAELAEWKLKTRGSTAIDKEINDLDFNLRKALFEKQTHGIQEHTRGKKEGREHAQKIWKYSLHDMNQKWHDGWEKGKNLAVIGKEEEFMNEKCNAMFEKGVASRQQYVYTDDDMKREIERVQQEIGNKICEPKECIAIS